MAEQGLQPRQTRRVVTSDHPNFLYLMVGQPARRASTQEMGVIVGYTGTYLNGRVVNSKVQMRIGGVVYSLDMADVEFPNSIPV